MPIINLESALPVEYAQSNPQTPQDIDPDETRSFILDWRNKLFNARREKVSVWDECWMLYRGVEDWTDKEDWQSKITIPKAWNSVKQATNVIKRLLSASQDPWSFEATNPDDLVTQLRAEQSTDLVKFFMEHAKYREAFAEGLECGFIMGLGIWKVWWGLSPRMRTQIEQAMVQGPNGPQMARQLVQREMLEGQLFIRAVDPYNFYWLPGSRLNHWAGTIEEIEVPKWELMAMAQQGVFDPALVDKCDVSQISPAVERRRIRFNEPVVGNLNVSKDTQNVKLTEYYGPLVKNNQILTRRAHVLLGGNNVTLLVDENPFLHRKPPYVAYSPLSLPFRTEGVGLIENVRGIDKGVNKLTNMGIDTLVFRLTPTFEVPLELYENPEDFETGITPGKIFRRTQAGAGMEGLRPVPFEDISSGTVQVQANLDRAHQEGALVSEIQQALPRFRGAQTASEIEIKNDNVQSFFGDMAVDIEEHALQPMLEMAWDLVFQFIDTAGDPRVASILGVGADVLRGMSKEEIQEIIQGEYRVKVSGISSQLEKADTLQHLTQFMNLIGQNPEVWVPNLNQSALLRRIIEAFRPSIRDIEEIINDPATTEANRQAIQNNQITPEMLATVPQMVDMAIKQQQAQQEAVQQQQQQAVQQEMLKLQVEKIQADIDLTKAKAAQARSSGGGTA